MIAAILALFLGCPAPDDAADDDACPIGLLDGADAGCVCDSATFDGTDVCAEYECREDGLVVYDTGCGDTAGCKGVDCD